MNQEKVWCVWCPTGGSPTVQHPTRDSAEREAARLANQHPGYRFFVMELVNAVERNTLTWMEEPIPF